MDNVTAAKQLLSYLDLTSLSNTDTEYSIADLCHKAQTPYGNTAAVCVYDRFIITAKQELADTGIKIATVVNFPAGDNDLKKIGHEIEHALAMGADEIDAVFPYRDFLAGNLDVCRQFLQTVTSLCTQHTSKIILETGELQTANNIRNASLLALDAGVGFLKTSTGKTKISATPEAANVMLETMKSSKYNTGFKASGGIKTVDDAKQYLILADTIMGSGWLRPEKFRIGATSLLNDILKTLKQGY